MIATYRDERGENVARIIDLGDLRVVSMDLFREGVEAPAGAEVIEVAGRYKLYVAVEEAPEGRVEVVIYDNGSRRQLIGVRYIGKLGRDEAIEYLKSVARRLLSNI
ncbi:MAG: hypothetical protein QXP98_05335 [Thermoproteus sp.]